MADTVTQLLAERADDDTTAILSDAGQWTWREYLADARATAAVVLQLADPQRPMHIGVLLANSPTMLIALAAGALGGYVTVGVNNTRRGQALAVEPGCAYYLKRQGCAASLGERGALDKARARVVLHAAEPREVGRGWHPRPAGLFPGHAALPPAAGRHDQLGRRPVPEPVVHARQFAQRQAAAHLPGRQPGPAR